MMPPPGPKPCHKKRPDGKSLEKRLAAIEASLKALEAKVADKK
jgi:hypothetical protein